MAIETARLVLREETPGDLDDLFEVLGDAETMRFYQRPFTREEVLDRWIARNMKLYAERGYGLWALVLKEEGRVIGQCGLLPQLVDGEKELEIGWLVNRSYQRRG